MASDIPAKPCLAQDELFVSLATAGIDTVSLLAHCRSVHMLSVAVSAKGLNTHRPMTPNRELAVP